MDANYVLNSAELRKVGGGLFYSLKFRRKNIQLIDHAGHRLCLMSDGLRYYLVCAECRLMLELADNIRENGGARA